MRSGWSCAPPVSRNVFPCALHLRYSIHQLQDRFRIFVWSNGMSRMLSAPCKPCKLDAPTQFGFWFDGSSNQQSDFENPESGRENQAGKFQELSSQKKLWNRLEIPLDGLNWNMRLHQWEIVHQKKLVGWSRLWAAKSRRWVGKSRPLRVFFLWWLHTLQKKNVNSSKTQLKVKAF